LAIITLLVGLVFLLLPIETETVPAWTLKVVDASGRKIANIGVREHWQNYSVEFSGHREDLVTNVDGDVTFPARTLRASPMRRLLYPLLNMLGGVHASWHGSAHIVVLLDDPTKIGDEIWSSGHPMPDKVVVRSLPGQG
jgi:hypothetical protein